MSLSSSGYTKDSIVAILSRASTNILNAIPNISLAPDNVLYQWLKTVSLEQLYIQNLIGQTINNMTVLGASGIFLDYHGNEAGIWRKDPIKANGYVQVTNPANGYLIPLGSIFTSTSSLNYETTSNVTIDKYITMRKSSELYDIIPLKYYSVTVSGIYTDTNLTIPITGYEISGMGIYIPTGVLSYNQTYYVEPTGAVVVNVPVQCTVEGISGNTAAGTITTNTYSLPITSVNNNTGIVNGLDMETDESYRLRLLNAKRKLFTLERFNDMVKQLEGVKTARTYQNTSVDRTTLDDWNDVSNYSGTYIPLTGTNTIGFTFFPSDGIGTLQKITMYGRITGNAPSLNIYLMGYTSGTYSEDDDLKIATTTIDRGVLNRYGENEFQDIEIPLQYNGLDKTKTYRVYIQPYSDCDIDNTWQFVYRDDDPTQSTGYRNQSFTGATGFDGKAFIYKTSYGTNGFTTTIIPNDGYTFTNLKSTITGMFDYIDGGGYTPVCVQGSVIETTKLYLSLSVIINLEPNFDIVSVRSNILLAIDSYLDSMSPGDDVIYSQIEKSILNVNGVKKIRNLQIRINDNNWITKSLEADLQVADNEYVQLDTLSLYSGVNIVEG